MRRFLSLSLSSLLIFCLCPWQSSANEIVAQSHVDRPLYKEGEVLVKWKKAARSQTKLAVNSKLGLDSITEYESLNTSRVAVAEGKTVEATLADLISDPLVYSAEPNYYVYTDATPNDPAYSSQWGLHNTGQIILGQSGTSDMDIDAPEAWDDELGANSVVVGVIDTGIQILHQDLDANIWVNTGEIANNGIDDDGNGYVDDVNGWDFKNNDKTVFDLGTEDYHSTHIAGIIAAERNNSVGGSGVAQVKIMPLKALDQSDGGTISDVVEAINYAAAKGVDIINMSFGSSSYSQTLKDAIDDHTDILFVTSAGNDGVDIDTSPQYPAAYTSSNLITVAAINNQGALATFTSGGSNYGDTHVDIGAPGRYIYSTLPTDAYPSGYGWISGTSQAAPFVSGAAALVLSYNNTLTTAQLKSRILDNGDATASLSGKTVTGDRLNVEKALEISIDMPALISKGPTGSGKTEIHVINGSDNYESFIANLVTGLGYVNPANAFLQLTDWNNNSNLDLVMIYSKGPTGSGKTEIHVVNGSNSYQSFLANLPTGLGYVDPANAFLQLLDWDGNGSLDLVMIFSKGPTGSGKTEIHVLNGSTSYKTFIANLATGLGYVDPANAFLQIVDWDGNGSLDLAMIFSKGPTGSGKTEIHVLSGSSSYKTFLANLATGLDYFDPANGFLELTDWDNNGSLDIAMIDSKGPTDSGKTEITVIDGSSSYQSTLTTLSTGMGYVDPTNGFIELTDWQ